MSIRIHKDKCVGCRRCVEACPGNLIKLDQEGHAYIRRPKDCWGCTSCIKECPVHAVSFFLGADIGGCGMEMTVTEKADVCIWNFHSPDGTLQQLEINKKDANKY